ncbi:MAG: putative ubiquinone biosynthesis monooxygenase [Bathelium mastoideum]|nr:MAG: putative ubiquinone biosynthesis monooxygenase [Bathelium mastoideum]
MEVWDGVSGSRISFDWASVGMPAAKAPGEDPTIIAYMTENANLTAALLKRLDELGGVSIMDNTRVSNIALGEDSDTLDLRSWPILNLSNGRTLAARLLIGSDGAQSPVRNFAGIESRGWDYERHGVVATLRLSDSPWQEAPYRTAYQRFLPTGPIALLPLPGPYASLVWSTLPSHAAHLKSLSPEDFVATVNAAFRLPPVDIAYMHRIPSGQVSELAWRTQHTPPPSNPSLIPPSASALQADTVASFPLRLRHAATYVGERVALVGDAAHTIHPLAGQGLNQGQGDVAALVGVVERAVREGADVGSVMALEAYDAERWAKNNALLGVVDKLHKLYSVGSGPIVGLRSLGLSAVDRMGWAKGLLMQAAAGVR